MKAEDAEEYTQALGQVVAGGWRQVALGERLGVPGALGLSTKDWVEQRLGGYVRMSIPERREAVAELASEEMSTREIADVIGVDHSTVARDLAVADATEDHEDEPFPEAEGLSFDLAVADATEDHEHEPEESIGETTESAEVPEPLAPAEPGWHHLGNHMLYCGDSTDPEFIAACQGALAFADPPYNAGKAEWDQGFKWQHDYLAESADIVAVTPGIAALGAQLFVYGFYDAQADRIVAGKALNVLTVLVMLATGVLGYSRQSRIDQTFLGFGVQQLRAVGAVIFEADNRRPPSDAEVLGLAASEIDDWPEVAKPGSGSYKRDVA